MKKTVALLVLACILVFSLVACKPDTPDTDKGAVNVAPLKDHDAVQALMITGEIDVAILPEPKATAAILAAKQQGHTYSIKLNLSTEWDAVSDYSLSMGCLAVNNSSLSAKSAEINAFLSGYKSSIEYINDRNNHESAAGMIVSAGILPKLPVAKSALTNLYGSIVYQDGAEMRATLESFYTAIGIALPSDAFYATTSAGTPATALKIGVMNGPTGMGMAKFIDDNKDNPSYEFVTYADPSIAIVDLKNGEIDLACLPTNAVANGANKGMPVSVLCINTLGSLYVVVKDGVEVDDIDDLVGKTVYYGVPTSTTEPIFKYILNKNDIEVKIVEE